MKQYGSGQFDRRQYPRLDFEIPIAFQKDDDSTKDGLTSNLSLGGMLAELPYLVNKSDILLITMLLPCSDGKKVFNVKAEVVWVVEDNSGSDWKCSVGLKFLEISADSFRIWRRFLVEWQGDKASTPKED